MRAEGDRSSTESRLTKLIWRTIKLRVFLLLLTLLIVFVIASTLQTGEQRAAKVDADFMQAQMEFLKNHGMDTAPMQALTPGTFTLMEQRIYEMALPIFSADPNSTKARDFIEGQLKQIDEYKQNRRDAFNIEVFVPYLKASVFVNALMLADVWPFSVVIMIIIVVVLGFQQKSYEVVLSSLIEGAKTESERSEKMVANEFFGGFLAKTTHRGKTIWLYKRPGVVSPWLLLIGGLLTAILLLSIKLLADYNPTNQHPTDSIFFSYYSFFWCFLATSAFFLRKTYAYYGERLSRALGAPVVGARLFQTRRMFQGFARACRGSWISRPLFSDSITAGLVAVSIGSLFMSWITPKEIKGYQFLFGQHPISTAQSIQLYLIDPSVYREQRAQVYAAIIFLCICLVQSVTGLSRRMRDRRLTARLRSWAAYVMLFLAGNYLLYLGVLQYESENPIDRAIVDLIFNPRGIASPRGLPMLLYNPTLGFWLFFACILTLALMSLKGPAPSAEARVC